MPDHLMISPLGHHTSTPNHLTVSLSHPQAATPPRFNLISLLDPLPSNSTTTPPDLPHLTSPESPQISLTLSQIIL
uniref:Uncharacterized protein n=1 Tax=Fagus sylvatica TaxID=28930 RepID=A0A2N9IL41_FAGSY